MTSHANPQSPSKKATHKQQFGKDNDDASIDMLGEIVPHTKVNFEKVKDGVLVYILVEMVQEKNRRMVMEMVAPAV